MKSSAAPRIDEANAAQPATDASGPSPSMAWIAEFPTRKADGDHSHPTSDQAPEAAGQEKRAMWKWAVAALVVAGVVAWLTLRNPAAPAAAPNTAAGPIELAAVDLATVEPRVLTRMLPLSGTISPFVQATVKSKVSGEVEQVTVREGQDVKAGDVLARIDTRNLQAEYDRELAAVEKAAADLDLAKLNRDKNRTPTAPAVGPRG